MRKSYEELPDDNKAIIEKYKISQDGFDHTGQSYECPSDQYFRDFKLLD